MITEAELRKIAARATTIYERLEGVAKIGMQGGGVERLNEWCRYSAHGDFDILSQHIARFGHDFNSAKGLFGEIHYEADAPLPNWISDFRWIANSLRFTKPTISEKEAEVPFAAIFGALV